MIKGRRKLGRIYAQPVEKRLGRVSVLYFFRKKFCYFPGLPSTFMRPIFAPVDLNVSDVKCV